MRFVIGVVLCLLASKAHADGMRCGDRLVSVGDTAGEVSIKCGSPTAQERRPKTDADGSTHVIETWTYNLGPSEFIRILRFRDGTLKKIESGGYGN